MLEVQIPKGFFSQVRRLTFKYNPNILVVMKARVQSTRAPKIIERINLPNFLEILTEGFSGGI